MIAVTPEQIYNIIGDSSCLLSNDYRSYVLPDVHESHRAELVDLFLLNGYTVTLSPGGNVTAVQT